jgi:transcriptional regulator of acetoin/glycerol metabolism
MTLTTSGSPSGPSQNVLNALATAFGQNVDIAASKRRCTDRYQLDASAKQKIICLTAPEIAEHREPFGDVLEMIAEEIDYVAAPLSSVAFGASFSNMAGTILYYRSDRSAGHYVDAEREGALWAEGVSGTNGVGTCIVERRPAQILGDQHFFRDHAHMSCSAVPVLSADAEMFGVLNFCSANPAIRQETFQLVSGLVQQTAERLNNQLFRAKFGNATVLRARGARGPLLLALDGEHRIIGANILARRWLNLSDGPIRTATLATMFEIDGRLDEMIAKSGAVTLRVQGDPISFKIMPRPALPNASAIGLRPGTGQRAGGRQISGPALLTIEDCLGNDPAMLGQANMLRRLSGGRLPILVLGETGTGKDTLARALHRESRRHDKAFVSFNCAAVPETLIDSELFGYGSGAFTGARREGNTGRLVEADGGTLFLDEIGDMPLALQTRLLRVLESGEVSPLGAGKTRTVDIQVIAATHQDLERCVRERKFRKDLYHRLSAVVVNMAPLRSRNDKSDIIRNILKNADPAGDIGLSTEALNCLTAYSWPGNNRELSYVLQRAIQLCDNGIIRPEDLLLNPGENLDALGEADLAVTARSMRRAVERRELLACFQQNDGDILRTAQALQISRATMYRKLKQYR